MNASLKEWVIRLTLLMMSLLVSVVAAEAILTLFFPLYGGRDNVTLDGVPLREWFPPSTVYRQISNEYDARTTITDKAHRVPGTGGNPDVIFLGDSFTYGFGLADEETFASIYCAALKVSCANLGMPGSGTAKQLARLEHFLRTYNWHPREVKLFFFGMSGSFSAGNDFADNFNYARRTGAQAPELDLKVEREEPHPGLAGRIISAQFFLLDHSNLVRRIKYYWGPALKAMLINDFGESRMAESLAFTEQSLREFDALSRQVGFDYKIYLIVPVQDIMRGTSGETLATLNRVAPRSVIPTAQLFVDHPERFYYHYDGHLNALGAARLGEFLVASEKRSLVLAPTVPE